MPRRILQVRVNLPQGFQNQRINGDNRFALARNQLYRIAFLRFTLTYARIFSGTHRRIFEFIVLLMALFSFVTLIYVHAVFVQSPITCLENHLKEWENAKILRVEVVNKNGMSNYSLHDSYYKEHAARLQEVGVQPCPRVQRLTEDENDPTKNESAQEPSYVDEPLDLADLLRCKLNETNERKSLYRLITDELGSVFTVEKSEEINIIEYSFEYGFLRLSPAMRKSLNLTVLFVVLDPKEDACIGGIFHRFIFDHFLGYDELLISSVRYLAHKSNYNGFVRNVRKEIEYIFVNDDGWFLSYIIAAIVMPLTMFSVSMLLRFAHQQIFIACTSIFELVRLHQQRTYNASCLLTVVFALFGMMSIISGFFNNSTLTLNITFMIWLADFYDSVCCRALMAKRHWYRFFLMYFYVFFAYNNRFNGLHWQLNLLTCWLFTLHSMLFFFHHYELPYYVQSFVTYRDTHHLRRREPPHVLRVPPGSNSERAASFSSREQQGENRAPNSDNSSGSQFVDDEGQIIDPVDRSVFQVQYNTENVSPSFLESPEKSSSKPCNTTSLLKDALKSHGEYNTNSLELSKIYPMRSLENSDDLSESLGKSSSESSVSSSFVKADKNDNLVDTNTVNLSETCEKGARDIFDKNYQKLNLNKVLCCSRKKNPLFQTITMSKSLEPKSGSDFQLNGHVYDLINILNERCSLLKTVQGEQDILAS